MNHLNQDNQLHPHHDSRDAAIQIIRILRDANHTALFAGGCVRDMLLNVVPKDYDVVTSAHPDEVQHLFHRTRAVGKQFGVILVRLFGHDIEVATFRTDHDYRDGRRPDHVVFTNDVDDAKRRDFTINGMFFDPIDDRVIDHVDGRADLDARMVRTIGDPAQRFAEDHLRLLRAIRFATHLGFDIDASTFAAIRHEAASLKHISAERISMELERILIDPNRARGWELLTASGIHRYLIDGWSVTPDQAKRIGRYLDAISRTPTSTPRSGSDPDIKTNVCATIIPYSLPLVILMGQRANSLVSLFAKNLRLSHACVLRMQWLMQHREMAQHVDALDCADMKIIAAHPDRVCLMMLWRADAMIADGMSGVVSTDALDGVISNIMSIDPIVAAPTALINGDHLCAAGFKPGPKFKRALDAAYRAQLNETITTKNQAMDVARRVLAQP